MHLKHANNIKNKCHMGWTNKKNLTLKAKPKIKLKNELA
jgi:hypothetical protein